MSRAKQMVPSFFILVLSIAALSLLFSNIASGASPGKLNFQGRLTDDAGQPINGTRNLEFRIYDDPASTTNLLWGPETHNGVNISNGIFSVELGSFTPLAQNVFNNKQCYLDIKVEGSQLNPRQQILTHGYSLVAETLRSGTTVGDVNISTLTLTGSRMYLTGGEGVGAGVFYLERRNTGELRDLLQMTLRLTGIGGAYYDSLEFNGKRAYFYKNTTDAILNMSGNHITGAGEITGSTVTANSMFFPPSGPSLPDGVTAGGIYYDNDNYLLYLATETPTNGVKSWVILGGAGQ